jgi:hypothetical protein
MAYFHVLNSLNKREMMHRWLRWSRERLRLRQEELRPLRGLWKRSAMQQKLAAEPKKLSASCQRLHCWLKHNRLRLLQRRSAALRCAAVSDLHTNLSVNVLQAGRADMHCADF